MTVQGCEKVDHNRGLCGKVENSNLSLEEFEKKSPHCRCCGATMVAYDDFSESFRALGIYEAVCPQCPAK